MKGKTTLYLDLLDALTGAFSVARRLAQASLTLMLLLNLDSGSLFAQQGGAPAPGRSAQKAAAAGDLKNVLTLSKCGLSYARASAKLSQRSPGPPASVPQPAALAISGIPAGAVIEKAFLWWIIENTSGGPSSATVKNPAGQTVVVPGILIGSDAVGKCWGGTGTSGWRADVTGLIAPLPGNGTYHVSGLPVAASGVDTDGVTLFIAYSVPGTGSKGSLIVNDGLIVNSSGVTPSVSQLAGFTGCKDPAARSFVQLSDFQHFTSNSGIHWNGGPLTPFVEDFWDWEEQTTAVTSGQTTMNTQVVGVADCIAWQVLGLSFRCPAAECNPCKQVTINARKQYAAKFVCHQAIEKPLQVVSGYYGTTLNVHNPWPCPSFFVATELERSIPIDDQPGPRIDLCPPVRFAKKVAIALPGQKPGRISNFRLATLKSDEAFQIDCADILAIAGAPPGSFLDGFVVIESEAALDVTAVYTARPANGEVSALEVEAVPERDVTTKLVFCN